MKLRTGLAVALGVLLCFEAASGQYFGRNKVRYRHFDFKVLHTRHFDVYYYGQVKQRANSAAQMLERWHSRYVKIFDFELHHQPVILYESPADFEQTNIIGGLIPQEVGGVTEPVARRIVVALTGVNADDDHVLGHELVHAFQFGAMQQRKDIAIQSLSAPLWFIEGMAEYLSIGGQDAFTAMWMRDAAISGKNPTIAQAADESRYFPYRYGNAIWAYLTGRFGDSSLAPLFGGIMRSGWKKGFQSSLGVKFDTLSIGWQKATKDAYGAKSPARDTGSKIGKALITGQGGYNLAPSLSPDGKSIVFLSVRDMFSFDLYLADAGTGKVLKKLTSSTRNQHFEEITYINSAGAWSPNGKEFALSVYDKGKNSIAIFNMESKKIDRFIPVENVDAIYQLAWSPDGTSIAFFGTANGYGMLYRYQFAYATVQPLTQAGYTAIEPAWSPDGATLAFATDQGPATNLDSFAYGPLRIGLMDMKTRAVTTISLSDKASHTNPQFSPDGKSLYFIADPDGIANIYRYDLSSGSSYRVTNVATGVAGLTTSSPAISVAKNSGTLAFNVFEKGNYNIYTLADTATRGTAMAPKDTALFALNAGLPPAKGGGIVDVYRRDHTTGLPDTNRFTVTPYKPRLTSITEGQAYGGAGVGGYGQGVGGGAVVLLSDELNDHQLALALQLDGNLQDFAGLAEYINQTNRFNWGASISHFPYFYGNIASGAGTKIVMVKTTVRTKDGTADSSIIVPDTIPTAVDTTDLTRLYSDNVTLFAQYPLSTNRRLEFSTGITRYGFSRTRYIDTSTPDRSSIYSETSFDIPAPPAQNLFSLSAAFIGDYSYYGFTGPINGSAYHFEVAPTFGSLQFASITADYRHYWFLKPLTLAFRAFHLGRYGGEADADSFNIFYLGDPTLLRGYWIYPVSGSNTTEIAQFNRLIGSRLAVSNFEARLPLFGTRQYGLIDFRYLPMDLIAFFDGGIAWTNSKPPVWKLSKTWDGNENIPLFSTGLGVRVNILGALIAEFDAAYPFQRPDRGMRFSWALAPGW